MDSAAAFLTCFDAEELPRPTVAVSQVKDKAAVASVIAPNAIHPRLRQRWSDLAAHAAEPNCFAESWFVEASLAHLDTPEDLRIVAVFGGSQGGMLLGVMPLHLSAPYGRMPVRHVTNWLHFHAFLGAPLVRKGHERQFWTEVLRLLDRLEWGKGFLHVTGIAEAGPVHRGLAEAARDLRRPCPVVHRSERALLESDLGPDAYYEQTVRKKKRKELKRLSARLAELGTVEFQTLRNEDELDSWAEEFLRLERAGWKGDKGSALACDMATESFFLDALNGAQRAGRLQFHRLDLDGRAIAMLINFIAPPGSFSFKIAIDEAYARFSPGVLIQIENLRILEREDVAWMDSCAAPDHPMINSLWGERRRIVRVTVPLGGIGRRLAYQLCRTAECASAGVRRLKRRPEPVMECDDE